MNIKELKQKIENRKKKYEIADFTSADTKPVVAYELGRLDGLVEVLGMIEE
jgi:hypothetical protein